MGRKNTDPEWNALARALCFRDERHMYEVLYTEQMLSVAEIAERLNAGTCTINRRMAQYGIRKRQRGGAQGTAVKKQLLWRLDQRVVMTLKNSALAEMLDISHGVVYHYKRWKYGNDVQAMSRNYMRADKPSFAENTH